MFFIFFFFFFLSSFSMVGHVCLCWVPGQWRRWDWRLSQPDISVRLIHKANLCILWACEIENGLHCFLSLSLSLFRAHIHTHTHTALVLRCLQAVQLLIPDIRRHFQWRLPQKQHILLTHFDHVTEVCISYTLAVGLLTVCMCTCMNTHFLLLCRTSAVTVWR